MNKRRIFIAIDLPDQIKKKLLAFQEQWFDLPVYWTKKTNLHLTLIFIGYVDDEEMLEICRLTKEVAKKHNPFEINFKKICLGPPDRPARMIWLTGEQNESLTQLKYGLEDVLLHSGKNRVFSPHVTLARINQNEWRELPDQPKLEKDVSFNFPVGEIRVMESHLSRSGAEYAVLESIELGT